MYQKHILKMTVLLMAVVLLTGWSIATKQKTRETGAPRKPSRIVDQLQYPKLNPIVEPTVIRETLPNGLRIILVEDHELPSISFNALVRGGFSADPASRSNLAELFSHVLRTGGTRTYSAEEVDQKLDRLGMAVDSNCNDVWFSLFSETLVENVDQILPLYAELIRYPNFSQDQIDLAKIHFRSVIARRNDDAAVIATRELKRLLYGPKSPKTRLMEYHDLDLMTRDDLLAMHQACFKPEWTILAAWGDFDSNILKEKLQKRFGDWKNPTPPAAISQTPLPETTSSINYIAKKDTEQTFIEMGHKGLKYNDPDMPAVTLLTAILGEGEFGSRIFNKVRTEKGLAYGAYGTVQPDYQQPGMFYFTTSTKPGSTVEVIQTILQEIKRIQEKPVTDRELAIAREGFLNKYAFDFDNKREIVTRLQTYAFYDYPADFRQRFRTAVEKVTAEDILRVAKRYLQPDHMALVAVGDGAKFDQPLNKLGQVQNIDITIPPATPSDRTLPPSHESLVMGRDLLEKVAKNSGERLRQVRDLQYTAIVTNFGPMGDVDMNVQTTMRFPDRMFTETSTPMGMVQQGLSPEGMWMKVGNSIQDMPSSKASEALTTMTTELGCLHLLRQVLDGTVSVQYMGSKTLGAQQTEAIVVKMGERSAWLFLSTDGSRLLGIRSEEQTPDGIAEVTEVFSDFQTIEGITVPMTSTRWNSEKKIGVVKIHTLRFDVGCADSFFEKPKGH